MATPPEPGSGILSAGGTYTSALLDWGGVGPSLEAHERGILDADSRAPQAPIDWVDGNPVAPEFDPVVLLGIDRLIRLGPFSDLAVAVGVQYGRNPSLRGCSIVGFFERRGVEPAYGVVLAEHNRVLFVEVVMVRRKTGVDHRELLRLRVEDLDLPGAWTRHRKVLGEFIDRSVFAERRLLLRGANPSRHPHMSVGIHSDAAGVSRPLPNFLVPPV